LPAAPDVVAPANEIILLAPNNHNRPPVRMHNLSNDTSSARLRAYMQFACKVVRHELPLHCE